MDYLITYITVIADDINIIMFIFMVLFLITSFFTVIGSIADPDENLRKRCSKVSKYTIWAFILSFIIFIITPTTKQWCAITILPKIVKGEKINEEDKIYQLCLEWFNDIKKKDKEKDKNN
jgi:hypothetical protein